MSFYIGGWFAGRLTGIGRVSESVLHGILSWGLVTVSVAFLLAFTAGRIMGGAIGMIGQGLGGGISYGLAGGPGDLRDAPRQEGDVTGRVQDNVKEAVRDAREAVRGETGEGMRESPGPTEQAAERGAQAAGAFGLFGFLAMAVQAAAAGYGARKGTRILRPVTESYRREGVVS